MISKDKALNSSTTVDLEILIATMDREDLSFLESIFSTSIASIKCHVLIVNQSSLKQLHSDIDTIRVINDSTYGLCRSRNIALQNAIGNHVWILDDDVVLVEGWEQRIKQSIREFPDHVALTFKAMSPAGGDMRYYPKKSFEYNKGHISGNPVSFEIVLNRHRLNATGITFNEIFGLGAKFPLCEEQILFYELLYAGERMRFIPHTVVTHPVESSGINPTRPQVIYARGALAQWLGQPIFLFKHKYAFFLWRHRYIKTLAQWQSVATMYQQGATDYSKAIMKKSNSSATV